MNAENCVTQAEPDPETEASEDVVIKLHEQAGLAEAEEFLQSCLDLPVDKKIVFDASALETVSTPYILTIASTLQSRAESSPKVALRGAPQPLIDAFNDLGLFESMMKMEFQ